MAVEPVPPEMVVLVAAVVLPMPTVVVLVVPRLTVPAPVVFKVRVPVPFVCSVKPVLVVLVLITGLAPLNVRLPAAVTLVAKLIPALPA